MATRAEEIRAEALRLPIHERARLAEELIGSLDEDSELDIAWAEEVERRMADVRAGAVELLDGDEVLRRLRTRKSG